MENVEVTEYQCRCCGFKTSKPMRKFNIASNGNHHNRESVNLCYVCSNTYDPIVHIEYPGNLTHPDTFRILRTMALIGMMIIDRLDTIIVKMNRN